MKNLNALPRIRNNTSRFMVLFVPSIAFGIAKQSELAGYWSVVLVERRDEYMQTLEAAGVNQDIVPFTKYLASLL
ncbi:hypothetical protein SAMN05216262_10413 [Colwellia chukchiensis]|uniref:Uncharacterized protein n=1 Tax=Colwellia chukchiensis TaxID=641665 RepID=A0A1H7L114_9GAMM|nr:hypothetical protein [Colwellia chukchiensis]SEK92729.1 hypothetical protein SAMN05216262_10413 [Colwellia chukchiensis]